MKLITLYRDLVGNDNLAQFESNLEVDLELPPDSKMALASANLKYNDDFITFTPLNSRFNIFTTKSRFDNDQPYEVELEEGKFNKVTILENIQSSINASIEYLFPEVGLQGLSNRTFFDGNDKLNISFGKSAFTLLDPVLNPNDIIEIDNVGGLNRLRRADPVGATFNFNAYALMDKVPISKGSGSVRFETADNVSSARFVIGLLNEVQDYTIVSQLPPSSYAVSISKSTAGNYVVNDTETDVVVESGQFIDMVINAGNVEFYISTLDDPRVQVGESIPYRNNLGNTDNYVYASLFGSGTTLFYDRYYPDPFFGIQTSTLPSGLEALPNTIITIDFAGVNENTDLGQILGFNNDVIQLQGNQSTFTGDFPLNFEVNEDAGVNVVIENLPLKSFNFTDPINRAQPILHSIPEGLRTTGGVISYTAPFLIPIELNNRFPINLRQMRFSIRNIKDNSIVLLNEISMAIVII